jgi:glyoxylase-like metal-dependent hydrolase (beta-lactamase superfamily II)
LKPTLIKLVGDHAITLNNSQNAKKLEMIWHGFILLFTQNLCTFQSFSMLNKINYRRSRFGKFFNVAPGVWGLKDLFVNIYMILNPFDGNWVLIDAGLKWSVLKIKKMAKQLFGEHSKPSSIILTHGHFDHIGALQKLVKDWDVPVFAHHLEIPFLTGKSSYPPPDPTVGGGLMSLMSWSYPNDPINISSYLNVLPDNGRVPGLPEWKYIHTPGHAPGHISLFRESDNVLIAGDAFVTSKAESAYSVILQTKKLSGPPKYFTYDWGLAKESVKNLMALEPEIVAAGHGAPMHGIELRESLHDLSEHFYELAVPPHGRYVNDAAIINATGVVYTPPNNINYRSLALKVLGLSALTATAFILLRKESRSKTKNKAALAYEVW